MGRFEFIPGHRSLALCILASAANPRRAATWEDARTAAVRLAAAAIIIVMVEKRKK